MKPTFLLHYELSCKVGLAPHPALSPRWCKQPWCNARGEGSRVRGHADFMQREDCSIDALYRPGSDLREVRDEDFRYKTALRAGHWPLNVTALSRPAIEGPSLI